jgi:hypothetical protein
MIRDSKSPTLVREMLLAYLPEKHRKKKASRYRPDPQITVVREAGDGQEKTWRRHIPEGTAGTCRSPTSWLDDELLCHARRLLQPGPAKAENRRRLDAGGVRRANRRAHTGIIESDGLPTRPKLKNTAHIPPEEAPYAYPDQKEAKSCFGRPAESRSRIRTCLGIAAAGIAGHA